MNLLEGYRVIRIGNGSSRLRTDVPSASEAWRQRAADSGIGSIAPIDVWETVEFNCDIRPGVNEAIDDQGYSGGAFAEMEL